MTPELDVDGPAAPPRLNGELSFEHPWQGRLFATTMALCDADVIEYATFREQLITEVAQHDVQTNHQGDYWSRWQDALETVIHRAGVCEPGEIAQRAVEFTRHH